jgi:hypothetical protein
MPVPDREDADCLRLPDLDVRTLYLGYLFSLRLGTLLPLLRLRTFIAL